MRINSEAIIFRFPYKCVEEDCIGWNVLALSLSLSLLLFENIFPIEEELKLLLVLEEEALKRYY